MSIAYQSWEIGSGPTVGYKVQAHPGGGDGLNFRKLIYRPPQVPVDAPPGKTTMPAKLMQPQQINNNNSSSTNNNLINGPSASCTLFRPRHSPGILEDSSRLAVGVEPGRALGVSSSSKDETEMPCSSSSVTSSISADTSDEDDKEVEVESPFTGPLEQMDSLMSTLPVRRGLSKFYVGKSRSFTSLADVKSMNIKDLAKPENPYAKRRRLPPSYHHREKFPPPRLSTGISKKPPSNGTTLTLAVAMSTKGEGLDSEESLASGTRWQKSCRSFSLTDLQKA